MSFGWWLSSLPEWTLDAVIFLLPLVLAGHFIGDWIVQTDWQAANKAKLWRADLEHVATYSVALAACCVWALHDWRLAVLLGVSAVTHAIIDRRWPVRWLLSHTGSERFSTMEWGVIATDQALHLSILCILVAALGR